MKILKFLAFTCIMLLFTANVMSAQGRNPNATDRFPKEHGRSMFDIDYWQFDIPCTGETVFGIVVTNCVYTQNSSVWTTWMNGEVKCYKTGNEYYLQSFVHLKNIEPGQTSSVVTSLSLIGKSGTKYNIHANMHITYNQDGEITASHDFEKVTCMDGN